jgi:methionine sulfoxide reductase heme-binding subunit
MASMSADTRIRWIAKPIVFAAALGPFAWLVWLVFAGGLGANPAETMNRFLGDWALRFLLLALAVTPARGLTGWGTVMVFRRMIGLFAFFYVTLHLLSYVVVDQTLDWPTIWADIVKRQYITVGMITFALLLPLAVTSTNGMVRRLGARRWVRLHRLVYAAGIGGVFHFFMMVKADLREPMIYAAVLSFLLGYRIYVARKRRRPKKVTPTP